MHSRHGMLIVVGAAESPFTVDDDRDSALVLAGIDELLHFAASKR